MAVLRHSFEQANPARVAGVKLVYWGFLCLVPPKLAAHWQTSWWQMKRFHILPLALFPKPSSSIFPAEEERGSPHLSQVGSSARAGTETQAVLIREAALCSCP